jgi:hypothetical protein
LPLATTSAAGEACFTLLGACVLALFVVASGTVESSGGRSDEVAVNITSISSSTSVDSGFEEEALSDANKCFVFVARLD